MTIAKVLAVYKTATSLIEDYRLFTCQPTPG